MREEKKMSSYTQMTSVSAGSNSYSVPVFKESVGNGYVPVRELAGVCDAGALTDAPSIDVSNNALSELSSSQSTLTLNVNCADGEVPNFAVEISASAAITLTVTKTVGGTVTTLWPSEAGGTSLESGKYYQITCVGNCWTLAEFTDPNAQRRVDTPDTRALNDLPEDSSSEGDDGEGILPEERGSDER